MLARPYQFRFTVGITDALATTAAGAILATATGTGKSLVILATAALTHQRQMFNRYLVTVPSVDLLDQFASYSGITIDLPRPLPDGSTKLTLPEVEVVPAGDHGRVLAQRFDATQERQSAPRVMVVTIDTLRLCYQSRLIHNYSDFRGTFLVIDEGHHIYGGDSLGANSTLVHGFRALGAKTLQATATPVRHDGRPTGLIGPDGTPDPIFERSLLQHLIEGYTPYLHTTFLQVGGHAVEADSEGLLRPATDERTGISILTQHWVQEGQPLTIIRDQCADTATNQQTRERLREALDAQGGNCLVLTSSMSDEERSRWQDLKQALRDKRSYPEIRAIAGVVIVHQMCNEGVDLPAFSHLYFWGVPKSMVVIQQMVGRVMRQRILDGVPLYADYPERWLTHSKTVFCTTNLAEGSPEEAQFCCEVYGWCQSLDTGALLALFHRVGIRLQFGVDAQGQPTSSRELASEEDAAAEVLTRVMPYLLEAGHRLDRMCQDPLNDITPARRVALLSTLAQQLMAQDPECQIPPEIRREIANLGARAHLARESGALVPAPEDPPLDAHTRALIAETHRRFEAESWSEHGYTLHEGVQQVFDTLALRAGLRTDLDQVLAKVQEFQHLHDKLPGGLGTALNREPVPGCQFCFDRYAHHAWREALVARIPSGDRLLRIRGARQQWGSIEGRRPARLVDFQKGISNRNDPLVLYGTEAMWLPGRYTWLGTWDWADVQRLGAWVGQGCQCYGDEGPACQIIDGWLRSEGPEGVLRRVRTGNFSTQEAAE